MFYAWSGFCPFVLDAGGFTWIMMHMPYVTSDMYVSRAGLLHIAAAMVTLFHSLSCDDGCIQHSRHCPLLLVLDAEPPRSRGAGGVGRSLRQPYATRMCARCIYVGFEVTNAMYVYIMHTIHLLLAIYTKLQLGYRPHGHCVWILRELQLIL